MRKVKFVLLNFFAVAVLLPVWPAQSAESSLSETLDWMDSTYNSHGASGGGYGHGLKETYSKGNLFERRTESFTYDGCEITLHEQDDPSAPLFSEMYVSYVEKFNLGDVDAASVKLYSASSQYGGISCDLVADAASCDMATIEFQTRNQKPLIAEQFHAVYPKLKGHDHDSTSANKTFVASFYLDDLEYAKRFDTAFRHAVQLCGGKPSTF
ncbi:MAG TPA: hypothetical protein VHU87_11345 [Rhizomicrobium sp.]|nr:hypothetical protein [Rhizomicrobium sp.]